MGGFRRIGLLAAAVLVLAGCGGQDTAEETATEAQAEASEEATQAQASEEEAAQPSEGPATVAVADSELGQILVDGERRTLYLFEQDTGPESTCYDQCAQNWPALVTTGDPQAGEGADQALLGTTERTDGSIQVTYADRPLYYFAGDAAAGDTNGQGVGDVWFVVGPDGSAVTSASG
jgi:predicted lipoprotein with Yx(FWY)xxD motif